MGSWAAWAVRLTLVSSNYMKTILLLLVLTVSFATCYSQTKIVYHQFEPTASDNVIIRWNIHSDSLPKRFVRETIDNTGRVIELKFYENNSLDYQRLCYLLTWIKFEYPNDTIIVQTNLNANGDKVCDLECGVPSQTTYHLTRDQKTIISSTNECFIDTAFYLKYGLTMESIIKSLSEIKRSDKTVPIIGEYSKSIAKLNGKLPVSKDFDISLFYFNETEKLEILKALRN